jgi:hypothetical protein
VRREGDLWLEDLSVHGLLFPHSEDAQRVGA